MKKQKNVFRVSALASAVLGAFAANTYAADDEVAQLIKPDSSISVGVGNQNNDRMRLGIYDGQPDNGAYGLVDADIKLRDDATGTWNELRLNNLGLDNREVFVSHSRQGDYGASFEYSRIPRESHYTVNTKLQYGDRGNNTIQETVPAVFTPGTGYNLRLGTVRDRYTLSIDKLLGGAFEFNAKYRQEEKQGRRFFSAYNGSVTQFLFEPIDTVTRQLDLMGSYLGKNLQLQAGYYGSWFRNDDSLIRFTSTSAATTNYVSLPPDNQAHQFYLNGAYTFTPTTKANFRMARTVASQDDNSLLSAIPAAGGAVAASFHGVRAKVVTTEYQMGLSSNPIKNLSLTANLHYHDRDDQTPYVPYNAQATPDYTTPRSNKSVNGKLEAAYRLLPTTRLLGGVYVEHRERNIPNNGINTAPAAPTNAGANWTVNTAAANDRSVPYRAKQTEVTYKGQVTQNFSDEFNGSLVLAHSSRDGSHFYWGRNQNLIAPLHMADRERDKLGLKFDWSPSEAVSLQAQFGLAKDNYDTNGLYGDAVSNGRVLYGTGVKDGSAKLFSLDGTFKVATDWEVTAFYSRDDSEAKQYAYQAAFGVDPIRRANLRDVGDTFGLGVKGKATSRLEVGGDLQWTRTKSQYRERNVLDAGATLNERLPDITNKSIRLALNGTYHLDKNSSVRADFVYDRWKTDDWTWLMWNNTSTALIPLAFSGDGTSVTTNDKQSATFLAVRYIYKF